MLIFVQESQQYSIAQINALNGTHNLKKKLKWFFLMVMSTILYFNQNVS